MPNQERTFNLKILLILSLGHLVTDIYQGALPAILPFLKAKLSISYTLTGVIMMTANFTSSIIQPLFGHLSDHKEKTILLPLGCLCAGLGLSFVSVPGHYAGVLLLVMISGLGVAAYHPEGYKTAHFFTGDRLATGMSVFSVGGNLGFALGPIIAIAIVTGLGLDYLPMMAVFSFVFLAPLLWSWKSLGAAKPVAVAKAAATEPAATGAYAALFLTIAVVVMRSWTQIGLMTYIPFYYIDFLKGEPIYAGTLVSGTLTRRRGGHLGWINACGPVGSQTLFDRLHASHKPAVPLDLRGTRNLLVRCPWSGGNGADFQFYGHHRDGSANSPEESRHCVRTDGGFCHWNRWPRGNHPRRSRRSLWHSDSSACHHGAPSNRTCPEPADQVPRAQPVNAGGRSKTSLGKGLHFGGQRQKSFCRLAHFRSASLLCSGRFTLEQGLLQACT